MLFRSKQFCIVVGLSLSSAIRFSLALLFCSQDLACRFGHWLLGRRQKCLLLVAAMLSLICGMIVLLMTKRRLSVKR